MFELCALAPINPGSIFFQVPDLLCLKFQYIGAGAHYSHFKSHAPPIQISPSFFRKGLDFGFSLLGLFLTPSFQNTSAVGIYCYSRILLFPKAEFPSYMQRLLEDIPEIKIPTKCTLILHSNTPTDISAMQLDCGIYTL